ncbi:MAG: hypothetical protein FJ083_16570 [Cyanobacteria bacterium K_Offshore_surface_m2_239]|nr:hypothetical protein [Cyanobacteria bacterium K_Offshore_surface_m2_239]
MLTGTELLAKVKDLGEASRTELVRATGYVRPKKGGGERLLFSAFYDALLEAKGITLGRAPGDGKSGRRLSYATKVQFNGNLMVGKAYTALLDLKPGDSFQIQLGRRQIKLIPLDAPPDPEDGASSNPADQREQPGQGLENHRRTISPVASWRLSPGGNPGERSPHPSGSRREAHQVPPGSTRSHQPGRPSGRPGLNAESFAARRAPRHQGRPERIPRPPAAPDAKSPGDEETPEPAPRASQKPHGTLKAQPTPSRLPHPTPSELPHRQAPSKFPNGQQTWTQET